MNRAGLIQGVFVSQVRVHNFTVSLDGFSAGEGQSLESPFGHAQGRLMEWFMGTRTFRAMHGENDGSNGVDEAFAGRWGPGIGAEIMGRNKFGPQRGPWENEDWKGWWGDDPVFHTPVFVLTHHPRPSIEMKGGTTFHFIDADPAQALARAKEAAGGLDVRIGGGPATVRQFLAADLIDHLHVVLVPIILGRGERLWEGLESLEERFSVESVSSPSGVTHLTFTRRRG
ncbi:DNA-binding protein [Kineosporia sp. NBRC 101731]|nr:DNA-binding protein [Kineosporia sp. NBRC 101731]